MAWISPEELVFSAWTDEYVMQGTFRKRLSRLTSWNTRTKEIRRYGVADGGLCYDRGNVVFWETDNPARRQWVTTGRLDGSLTRDERALRYDELMTCLPYDELPPLPARDVEHEFVRLRPEHGFIDLGPQRSMANTPIRLYKPGNSVGIELPFKRREFQQGTIRYFTFKGAYFILSSYFDPVRGYGISPWPEGVPRPVWWLYPDGRVEEIIVPYAKWMRGRIVPTKTGLLALNNTFFTITGEAPFDGVYLIDGRGGQRLLRGVLEENDVSEGGCKFAVRRAVEPATKRPMYLTVTVLELCREAL